MNRDKLANMLNILPLKNTIIFESSPDLTDNSYYLFKYLVENYHIQDRYKLVWFMYDYSKRQDTLCDVPITCVDNNSKSTGIVTKLKRLYYNFTAKAIIDSNMFVYKKRNKQIRIYADHGMPLKEPVVYLSNIGKCDLVSVAGDFFKDIYGKYTDRDSIQVMGLPRDEALLNKDRSNSCVKKILWMPTFRQHKNRKGEPENIFPFGVPVAKTTEDFEKLNNSLKENNMLLLLRLHPAQNTAILKGVDASNIVIADNDYLKKNNMMLEDMLVDSDALITDYSSVYYDYMFTGNPIGLTFEDVDLYKETCDLVFDDIVKDMTGRLIWNMEDLLAFVNEINMNIDEYKKEREDFCEKIGMRKMHSCKLISEFLMSKLGEF